jgi:hypothetical protein
MSDKNEIATKRIALTPTHFDQIRDFSRGLGATYDEAIELLLSLAKQPGEDELIAGRRLRDKLNAQRHPHRDS